MNILRSATYTQGGGGGAMSDSSDAGSENDRLSLDPSNPQWQKLLDGWEDGGDYSLKIKVNQISPGEFRVTSVMEDSSPEAASEGDDEDNGGDKGEAAPMSSKNPAVNSMLQS